MYKKLIIKLDEIEEKSNQENNLVTRIKILDIQHEAIEILDQLSEEEGRVLFDRIAEVSEVMR